MPQGVDDANDSQNDTGEEDQRGAADEVFRLEEKQDIILVLQTL